MKISAEIASCSDAGRVVFVCVCDIAQKQTKQKIAHEIVRKKKIACCKRKIKKTVGYLFSLFLSLISVQTRLAVLLSLQKLIGLCGGLVSTAVTRLLAGFQAKGENVLEHLCVCPQLFVALCKHLVLHSQSGRNWGLFDVSLVF